MMRGCSVMTVEASQMTPHPPFQTDYTSLPTLPHDDRSNFKKLWNEAGMLLKKMVVSRW
jgi:hypothetical protein